MVTTKHQFWLAGDRRKSFLAIHINYWSALTINVDSSHLTVLVTVGKQNMLILSSRNRRYLGSNSVLLILFYEGILT